ncbi:MAG: beta-propeller domain-containing protein, partial [Candidatus Bathyarchaeota archaeon]|nr:beta-propeller domain-containing protein [Candidatus Bathyarchaeota archaeon]
GNHYHFVLTRTPYAYTGETFIKVYDISDRANPVLTRTISLNGTLSGSRMIGNYVYAVVNQPAILPSSNETDLEVFLPKIFIDGAVKEVQPTEIRYVNVSDVFYYFTTVVAVNVINDAQEPTYEPFLTGATACMYVSQSNMYLAVPNTNVWITPLEVGEAREETLIYRVTLDMEKIVCEDEGAVSGYVLNQFSMDEYNGFFRIATTKWTNDGSKNNLYTMNMSLNIVGKLEDLAPDERIYSARFMGDRCYLVTFKQVDPFFVIDLSHPAEPKVLGYLKIPGFSGYLHPYDENHIIGMGKQDNNVKLSLFNVTNVTAPTETAKFVVQGEWSDSTVLMDHKAFLFDRSKHLLALPVSISWIEMKGDGYYTKGFWQGAYVFDINRSEGFVLRGNVTHQEVTDGWYSEYWVKRSLYIENVLYTVSDKKIKMNSLEDLVFIKEIELS